MTSPEPAEVVVDKFGGSVLRRPDDIAAAVDVVARQRAAGMDAVWLDRRDGASITPSDEPIPTDVRRIHGLDELPEILAAGGPLPRGEGVPAPGAAPG